MGFSLTNLGFLLSFDAIGTLVIGLLSLYLGKRIKQNSPLLYKLGFPAAVIGGLIFAIIHLIIRNTNIGNIDYTTTLQWPFMTLFFTTIGIGSSISALKKGGKLLIIFWLLSGVMTFMQTVIGVGVAKVMGLNSLLGVLAGSVSMSGGHGAAGAFGKTVENLGVHGAATMALSSATFGLIAGGLLGAPLGIYLIKKHNLKPINVINKDELDIDEKFDIKKITSETLLAHIFALCTIMSIGMSLTKFLKVTLPDIALPDYVLSMFVAIIFNNLNLKYKWIDLDRNLIDMIGMVSLNIFLSMALISLKLWELSALAVPMLVILVVQVVFMAFFTSQILFRAMGKNYDSAVMVAGMCGSGLGATTNAMLNMGEVADRHGYTMNPFLIVTLTGAFLIDIFQMPIIIMAINMFK